MEATKKPEMKITVETSARHVHVTQQDLETLFGAGYQLHKKKDLSQPGEFASEEKVTIVGPKREIEASILGPVRKATQVELSLTDGRTIGMSLPVMESGKVAGSPGCIIKGPAGQVELKEGVIAAKRHVHMTEEDAKKWGLENGTIVKVCCGSNSRNLVFDDVVLRVSPKYATFCHIDTDESNAAGGPTEGTIEL